MKICENCKIKFPIRVEINGKERNLQRRKYCLRCSPFGKHNTQPFGNSSKNIHPEPPTKICAICKIEKLISEFYIRPHKHGRRPVCKVCMNMFTVSRQRKFKKKCIDYKGGKCECCGYNKCDSALEFHHINSEEKDFSISKYRLNSFTDVVKHELDKCQILCANCHREEHEKKLQQGV
jgi:hypothetical protein